ncbi:unnamed protein product [Lymnaea stagnalis]|uniref:AIG1-type G domain-containing protein n=1 Tax=Lymnaea stagnalis TaxID=6523 RepID=A0AAV2HBV4_LYMST
MAQVELSYNLMLLGKTGAGKSSTGNTLLDRKCFTSSISFNSSEDVAKKHCKAFKKYTLCVVDTPGVHDTHKPTGEIVKNLHDAMGLIPEGFNALIFVIKLGERCTEELLETIKVIKALFGDTNFSDVCIVALTNGEDAEKYNVNNQNIQEWLRRPENVRPGSDLETLLRECGYRAVLFYNNTPDKREESVEKLITCLPQQAPRYTNEHFQKCADERDAYMTSWGFPGQRANIQTQLSLLTATIEDTLKYDMTNVEPALSKINDLKKLLETESKGTDSLEDLKIQVTNIESEMSNLPEDADQRIEVIKNVEQKVNGMKNAGLFSSAFAVLSGCGTAINVGLAATRIVSGIPVFGIGIALGMVVVGSTAFAIYALVKAYKSTKSKKEDKEKLL